MIANSSFTIHSILPDELEKALDVHRQYEDFLAPGPDPRAVTPLDYLHEEARR